MLRDRARSRCTGSGRGSVQARRVLHTRLGTNIHFQSCFVHGAVMLKQEIGSWKTVPRKLETLETLET